MKLIIHGVLDILKGMKKLSVHGARRQSLVERISKFTFAFILLHHTYPTKF